MLQPRAPPTLSHAMVVGTGATAKVYKAYVEERGGFTRLRPGQFVAIKEMLGVSRKRIQAIELEVAMHKSITHPNVVSYLGFYVADDAPDAAEHRLVDSDKMRAHILLEYCDGGSLHHLYQDSEKPLPEGAIRSYLYQACRGLVYLHQRGIVHRDIKGLNLLLSHDGVCKLSDFGCAVDLGQREDGQFHSLQGTPFWMAPEMFEVSSNGVGGNVAADIWSIGATAWELAVGDRPFRNVGNDFQLVLFMSETTSDDDIFPGDLEERVGSNVYRFIRRCMRRRPADRPTIAELLKDEFFADCEAAEDERFASLDGTNLLQPAAATITSQQPPLATAEGVPAAQGVLPAGLDLAHAAGAGDAATLQWLQQAVGPSASPDTVASAASSSTSGYDESAKLRPALQWWSAQGFKGETTASAFFDALRCPNLQPMLYPVVVWGRDGNSTSSGSSEPRQEIIRFTDFVRFVQFFGPFDSILLDAKELGGEGDDYGGYSGYGDYRYTCDAPRLILTWQSQEWFRPEWSQAKAEEYLASVQPGGFVVRFSSRWRENPGSYTLSMKGERGVSHYRVLRPGSNAWSFLLAPHDRETFYYDSLEELVAHCREIGIKSLKRDKIYKLLG